MPKTTTLRDSAPYDDPIGDGTVRFDFADPNIWTNGIPVDGDIVVLLVPSSFMSGSPTPPQSILHNVPYRFMPKMVIQRADWDSYMGGLTWYQYYDSIDQIAAVTTLQFTDGNDSYDNPTDSGGIYDLTHPAGDNTDYNSSYHWWTNFFSDMVVDSGGFSQMSNDLGGIYQALDVDNWNSDLSMYAAYYNIVGNIGSVAGLAQLMFNKDSLNSVAQTVTYGVPGLSTTTFGLILANTAAVFFNTGTALVPASFFVGRTIEVVYCNTHSTIGMHAKILSAAYNNTTSGWTNTVTVTVDTALSGINTGTSIVRVLKPEEANAFALSVNASGQVPVSNLPTEYLTSGEQTALTNAASNAATAASQATNANTTATAIKTKTDALPTAFPSVDGSGKVALSTAGQAALIAALESETFFKVIHAYAAGNYTADQVNKKITFYDTDGTTVLLTQNFTEDGFNRVTARTIS